MAVVESAFGAVSKIGPYFTAVSLVPAAMLTFTVDMLGRTQPWTGTPNWHRIIDVPSAASLSAALIGAVLTIILAMVLHPLQFAAVQLLEGYWGTRSILLRAADLRISHHTSRFGKLAEIQQNALTEGPQPGDQVDPTPDQLQSIWHFREASRALGDFPDDEQDIMPTRLGNILKRYERRAGKPYGIDAILIATHIGLIAPKEQVDYLQDQRTQMDLAVRLTLSATILTIVVTLMFAPAGWWALLGLVPYIAAIGFYRGACVVAHHYGNALETVIDLNRRQLYEVLDLHTPTSLVEERKQNEHLQAVLRRSDLADMSHDSGAGPVDTKYRRHHLKRIIYLVRRFMTRLGN